MPVTLTSTDVANQALQIIGDNETVVTGLYPNFTSINPPASIALNLIYGTVVASVARQFSWDYARAQAPMTLSGNVGPIGWMYEYLYPTNAAQVWQLIPPTIADPNDPIPVRWARANNLVSGIQVPVIWTNLADAVAVFNNNPLESVWDPIFTQTVIRVLANELATALAGRPDTATAMMEIGSTYETIGESRDS